MRSLKRRFNKISKLNPKWSTYICFEEAVKKQNFSRRIIYYWFNKLVEQDDYDPTQKKKIIEQLISLSTNSKNIAEEGMF